MPTNQLVVDVAKQDDLQSLIDLENRCFETDRLSRRSFRYWLSNEQCVFLTAHIQQQLVGYILIIYHRGTRLARLYSITIDPKFRGKGIAGTLMLAGEERAQRDGRLYMRLEVNIDNHTAIGLYERQGYKRFGLYHDYYEDHSDALRMQKTIRQYQMPTSQQQIPWIQQTTRFTCGPAALMMAMAALDPDYEASQQEELNIWREATTIFMTSGHGGSHPVGLALAAQRRGFSAEIWINRKTPLFVDGVRNEKKKKIIELVDPLFVKEAVTKKIPIHYKDVSQVELVESINKGQVPVILISTFRMDYKKAPHWVVLSGYDDDCLYVHDPDPVKEQNSLDCQFMPIARDNFAKMSTFGASRLRTAVTIGPRKSS